MDKSFVLALVMPLVLTLSTMAGAADVATDAALEQKILEVIRKHPREIMESITAYQRAQQTSRDQALAKRVAEQVGKLPQEQFLGASPARGAAARKLVLVEFSDFQCPYCKRAHEVVTRFMDKHADEVTLVYKHLPLVDLHPEAANAAMAAWAAHQQGKFWEFHDALFAGQDKLGEQYYQDLATRFGLDVERFNRDRRSDPGRAAVNADLDLAQKLGLTSTPTFVLNTIAVPGAVPIEVFEKALAEARKNLGQPP